MARRRRQQQPSQTVERQQPQIASYLTYLVLGLFIAIFVALCIKYQLTQDDAYISFRYAANLLSGEGLVYNSGERVEGYTNFLWVILLALFKGVFNIDYLLSSRVLGVLAGAMIFPLTYLLLRHRFKRRWLTLYTALALMLLSNLSLPYWSIASLETAAFAGMILAALVAEYRRPSLTPALLIIATLLRPEGGLVFVVVLLHRLLSEKKLPLRYILIYLVPLLPFAAFKLFYYGSLFPNPYYAKSGVGLEYILSGLEYLWYFTSTVGLYGAVFLVPLLAIKKLWREYSLLYLFVIFYVAYIVWVGGDVLKVYRFFVPVIPVLYFLFIISVRELAAILLVNRYQVLAITWLVAAVFAGGSLGRSYKHVNTYWFAERAIVTKMEFMSSKLKEHMSPDFSLAASTIGMVGYQLQGHRVIDMLGLTDSYIARNPEKVKGIESTWKERRFNNHYLLDQQPDFILFSTGYKPSAPAERALLLHSEFRKKYSPTGFLRDNQYKVVHMRKGEVDIDEDIVHPDIEFVNKFNIGYNHVVRRDFKQALIAFRETWQRLGEEYPILLYTMGDCFMRQNQRDSAAVYFNRALVLDPGCWEARLRLIWLANDRGDTAAANEQYQEIMRTSPWILDYLDQKKSTGQTTP